MAQKPSIPKGTRDFTPDEMRKRNFIFDTLKSVFQLYGFEQIETPAMENLSTLLGKYGEEGDKLLFRILNSGDFLADVTDEKYKARNLPQLSAVMCEKGLRYDLTVPFARFVVQNRESLQFPFKRYQIQPVWRADRPQRGRYREFYQCDVDVVGSDSLLNEVELIQIIDKGFQKLGVRTLIKINNRKILSGIAEIIGQPDKITDITVAIDKLEKIGIDKVKEELRTREITDDAITKLQPIFELSGSNEEKLLKLKDWISSSEIGLKGIDELQTVFTIAKTLEVNTPIELDLTLARGLNYYTGAIFEVKARDVEIGSICGGGRYDNLTGIFGLPGVSGVGISFGADRIFDVLNQLNSYPADTSQCTQILFTNFGEKEAVYCLPLLQKLRNAEIMAELYPDNAKMKKQMGYADAKKIPFVAMIGEDEMNSGSISLKNMTTGEQTKVTLTELIEKLR
jgi:histidyl-tRNA synthetase